jgi:hypothetical protein
MDDHINTRVASRDLPSYIGAVIGRGVVDDEHPHIHAQLVIEHTGDCVVEELTVFITRDDDAD